MKTYQYIITYMLMAMLAIMLVNYFTKLIWDIISVVGLMSVAWIIWELDHAIPMPSDYED